ncbi:hypothetical protein A3A21_02980 [Candidatus Jorgensenbacteria bacterium RIFCSPLOWO2_01_FULL_45_25b]|uniref:Addiction module toxin, HicA family n=1 Tax=Candidatus Jorgensenbacteria bacterium RIFCSPLOWO2_01_FULL_45_25b TaxID=1798471 RepID=A0A1F6BY38_9BACT|nr:MAG: hypothetical protein A3A21_02980 [Candidatus Jorgensenbacteria bacterium RIFCSPLOWO2_01_FULL_45_25b]
MPRKSDVSWKEFEKFLLFIGCSFERERGDHRIFWRSDLKRPVIFPRYNPLPLFIIRNNLRILGLSFKQFEEFLKRM